MKRKRKSSCPSPLLDDSPKRTKVHAQRKFAQGSNVNSPAITPIKELEPEMPHIDVLPEPVELLPIKRPNTEDFLTFLCFRGTPILPQSLNFFNTASIVDTNGQVHEIKSESSPKNGPIDIAKCGSSSEKPFIAFGVRKRADPVVISRQMDRKRRHALTIQALRRKYQEQKMAKIRALTISKLSEKVTNKTLVRTNTVSKTETVTKKSNTLQKTKVIATKHIKVTTQTLKTTLRPKVKQKMCLRSFRGRFVQKELPFRKRIVSDKKIVKKLPVRETELGKKKEVVDYVSEDEAPLSKQPKQNHMPSKIIKKAASESKAEPSVHTSPRVTRSRLSNTNMDARRKIKKRILLANPTPLVKPRSLRTTTIKKTVLSRRKSRSLKAKQLLRARQRESTDHLSDHSNPVKVNKKETLRTVDERTNIKKSSYIKKETRQTNKKVDIKNEVTKATDVKRDFKKVVDIQKQSRTFFKGEKNQVNKSTDIHKEISKSTGIKKDVCRSAEVKKGTKVSGVVEKKEVNSSKNVNKEVTKITDVKKASDTLQDIPESKMKKDNSKTTENYSENVKSDTNILKNKAKTEQKKTKQNDKKVIQDSNPAVPGKRLKKEINKTTENVKKQVKVSNSSGEKTKTEVERDSNVPEDEVKIEQNKNTEVVKKVIKDSNRMKKKINETSTNVKRPVKDSEVKPVKKGITKPTESDNEGKVKTKVAESTVHIKIVRNEPNSCENKVKKEIIKPTEHDLTHESKVIETKLKKENPETAMNFRNALMTSKTSEGDIKKSDIKSIENVELDMKDPKILEERIKISHTKALESIDEVKKHSDIPENKAEKEVNETMENVKNVLNKKKDSIIPDNPSKEILTTNKNTGEDMQTSKKECKNEDNIEKGGSKIEVIKKSSNKVAGKTKTSTCIEKYKKQSKNIDKFTLETAIIKEVAAPILKKEITTILTNKSDTEFPNKKEEAVKKDSSESLAKKKCPDYSNKCKKEYQKKEEADKQKIIQTLDESIPKLTQRPSRKTKEAAAIYMEILSHKLVSDTKEDDDDNGSIDSYPELPNVKKTEQRENELKAQAKSTKHDNKEKPKLLQNTKKTELLDSKSKDVEEKPKTLMTARKSPYREDGIEDVTKSIKNFAEKNVNTNKTDLIENKDKAIKDLGREKQKNLTTAQKTDQGEEALDLPTKLTKTNDEKIKVPLNTKKSEQSENELKLQMNPKINLERKPESSIVNKTEHRDRDLETLSNCVDNTDENIKVVLNVLKTEQETALKSQDLVKDEIEEKPKILVIADNAKYEEPKFTKFVEEKEKAAVNVKKTEQMHEFKSKVVSKDIEEKERWFKILTKSIQKEWDSEVPIKDTKICIEEKLEMFPYAKNPERKDDELQAPVKTEEQPKLLTIANKTEQSVSDLVSLAGFIQSKGKEIGLKDQTNTKTVMEKQPEIPTVANKTETREHNLETPVKLKKRIIEEKLKILPISKKVEISEYDLETKGTPIIIKENLKVVPNIKKIDQIDQELKAKEYSVKGPIKESSQRMPILKTAEQLEAKEKLDESSVTVSKVTTKINKIAHREHNLDVLVEDHINETHKVNDFTIKSAKKNLPNTENDIIGSVTDCDEKAKMFLLANSDDNHISKKPTTSLSGSQSSKGKLFGNKKIAREKQEGKMLTGSGNSNKGKKIADDDTNTMLSIEDIPDDMKLIQLQRCKIGPILDKALTDENIDSRKITNRRKSVRKRKSQEDIDPLSDMESDEGLKKSKVKKSALVECPKDSRDIGRSSVNTSDGGDTQLTKRKTRSLSQIYKDADSDDSDESFHVHIKVPRKKKVTRSKVNKTSKNTGSIDAFDDTNKLIPSKVAIISKEVLSFCCSSDHSTTSDVNLQTLANKVKNKKFTKTKAMKKPESAFFDSDEEPLSKLTGRSVEGSQRSCVPSDKPKDDIKSKEINKVNTKVKNLCKKSELKPLEVEVVKTEMIKPKRECAKRPQNYLPMLSSSDEEEIFHGFDEKTKEKSIKSNPLLDPSCSHVPPLIDLLSKDIGRRFGKEKVNMSNEQIEKWLKESALAGSSIKKENDEMLKFGERIPTETSLERIEPVDTRKLKLSLLDEPKIAKKEDASKIESACSTPVISDNNDSKPNSPAKPQPLDRKLIFRKNKTDMAPNINAFSPENESSVYAFGEETEDLISTPFRRPSRRPSSTATSRSEDESSKHDDSFKAGHFRKPTSKQDAPKTSKEESDPNIDTDESYPFYIPQKPCKSGYSKYQNRTLLKAAKSSDKIPDLDEFKYKIPSSPSASSSSSAKLYKRQTQKQKVRPPEYISSVYMSDFPKRNDPAKLVEAPVFHPTEQEFQDPLEYIERIRHKAEQFGLCRIVPPSSFKPECKVTDDMRFTAYDQYVHKMLYRWGPNFKELMAIKKYLETQNITLTHPPWIGGMEIDLPRLYQTVQNLGGLKEVIEKKKWPRVSELMKIPKSAQDRVTKLDDIYCKYLLPYDTLSPAEREKLFDDVETEWAKRESKTLMKAQQKLINPDKAADGDSEPDDFEECITKGRNMALNAFYRIARNTMSMHFKTGEPTAQEVEQEYWKYVTMRQNHICVHSGSIDSGNWGYGFAISKNSPFARHPWNLKVLTNNSGSLLRSLGPIMGVTVPTLHVGMVFSACCWYRDPHGLPWIEYLHTGGSKIWYGIPNATSDLFHSAFKQLVPNYCKNKELWLPSDTAMVPPSLLVENNVSLCRTVQDPGQFVIVFPKAFSSNVSTGYVVSESVYFAPTYWLKTARSLFDTLRNSSEPSMFSLDRLLLSIANDVRSSQEILRQIIPHLQDSCNKEKERRVRLSGLGDMAREKMPIPEVNRKKKKLQHGEEGDYECDMCRMNLFVSLVFDTHEAVTYCLDHAIEMIEKNKCQPANCKFMFTYDDGELESLPDKIRLIIENKQQKKVPNKYAGMPTLLTK